ncbi:Crp/Fnr family transcriptional regulator [Pseudomonas sp. NUPR-001]|uniref:Crp/Fnr family transcriptional regulator n=1 Tax=Pseudomonas sp. NUPR-001 TaxID=3416058 RepID=UPI003F9D819F
MSKRPRCVETWYLDDRAIGPLLRALHLGRRRICRKGEYLYRQGEVDHYFYLILRGHILISSVREDGSEFTLEMMGPRAVCGEAAAFDGKPCFTSAIALEEVEVVIFRADEMSAAFAEHPDIAVALLRITAMKQRIIAVRAQYLASLKPEARITELLHRLAEQYGQRDGNTREIGISLTHKQIAALTGTTRVTVTRVLKRLRENGEVTIQGRCILVKDMEQLMPGARSRSPHITQ